MKTGSFQAVDSSCKCMGWDDQETDLPCEKIKARHCMMELTPKNAGEAGCNGWKRTMRYAPGVNPSTNGLACPSQGEDKDMDSAWCEPNNNCGYGADFPTGICEQPMLQTGDGEQNQLKLKERIHKKVSQMSTGNGAICHLLGAKIYADANSDADTNGVVADSDACPDLQPVPCVCQMDDWSISQNAYAAECINGKQITKRNVSQEAKYGGAECGSSGDCGPMQQAEEPWGERACV